MSGPDRDRALAALRARLVDIARRRVAGDAVEDVVQDALRVIAEKGPALAGGADVDGLPPVAWCFQVLRNTIGTHYQSRRVHERRLDPEAGLVGIAATEPTPAEAMESSEVIRLVDESLGAMDRGGDRCGYYLRSLAAGVAPGELASREQLDEAALYRRIYRCRLKLRALLEEKGVRV